MTILIKKEDQEIGWLIYKIRAIRQLFYVKMYVNIKKYGMDIRNFGQNYRVDMLSTFYLTVSGIVIPSLKSMFKMHVYSDNLKMIVQTVS